MDDHEIIYIGFANGDGFVHCEYCGWRSDVMEQRRAEGLGDRHLHLASVGRLNSGPTPSVRSLIKQYRANAANLTYNRTERIQWAVLADELETELLAQDKKRQLEGQLEIPFN